MNIAGMKDFRARARRRLPDFLFQYIDGGAYQEQTLDANTADFRKLVLRQRALLDVSGVDLSVDLFGQTWSMPVGLGPIGLAGMYRKRGETMAARAAAGAGVPFMLSSLSLCSVEETAAASPAPIWFQLYMVKDRGFVRELIARAKEANCSVMTLTVDVPVTAVRWRDIVSGLSAQPTLASRTKFWREVATHPAWAWEVGVNGRPHGCGNLAPVMPPKPKLNHYWAWVGRNLDASLTWDIIDFIREQWDRPLLVKGIMDPEDARRAVSAGLDGLVVSNHGGRQLDSSPSTISALPRIVEAVDGAMPVLMDGGVRSGTDVLKALGSGASAVLLGRAWAYALAGAGERGVELMLAQMRQELTSAMAMAGATSARAIRPGDVLDPLSRP